MADLSMTIAPKSDQLNSDDLIGRVMTIKVTKVSLCAEPEQPIAINFDGDNGKPYKPGKSMRRVLVQVWGSDGNAYVGRSMTLFRDEKVLFGGQAVGGIRISHMTDITEPRTMALTASKAQRKPFTVKPLILTAAPKNGPDPDLLLARAKEEAAKGTVAYYALWGALSKGEKTILLPHHETLKLTAKGVDDEAELDKTLDAPRVDDAFPGDTP